MSGECTMTFEPGGMADKLGNRYEGRWVAKQLLRLLNEEIKSVTVELIGPDERGVDLLVVKKDGTRQLQQCKARSGRLKSWSVAALNDKEILTNLRDHLDRNPQQEFALVSPIPGQSFADICDSGRYSNNNPNDFFQYQIQDVGDERRKIFRGFCNALSLDPGKKEDLTRVFGYLKRTYIELYPDDHHTWSDLLMWTGFLLAGKPETAISILLSYAENEDRYRKPIYADELRRFLAEKHQVHPKQLEHDQRIGPAVEELQKQFSESIQPGLIGGMVVPREEASRTAEFINKNQDVVVHGAAGNGKSGILYELTEYLRDLNILYLPIRLDRRMPDKSARQFGEDMGLPGSPAFALAGLAAGRQSVLILDQLDAIRWTGAHSAVAMDVCKELVRQVRSLRHARKKIVIVFACRTFDLENDPEIKNFLADAENQDFVTIPVGEFSDEQLKKIIGRDFDTLRRSQKRILSCPHNLAMWMQLRQDGMKPDFRSATELMRRFWENRRHVLKQKAGISADQIEAFLKPLLDYMESKGEISAPASIVSQNPSTRDLLTSFGILQQSSGRIGFCHQRYMDYLIAERLLLLIYNETGSLSEWLGTKERQSLFRREQLRQVLTLMADESPSYFLITAKELLESLDVRFHLKHLVLELIGQLNEIREEIGHYCLTLVKKEYWQNHVFETVFYGHPPWVCYLLRSGTVSGWISSSEEHDVNHALWLLRSVADHIPDQVTEVLAPFVNRGVDWPDRVLNTICWRETHDSEQMFELRLQLARTGCVKNFVDWKSLCAKFPMRAIRLIEAVISNWRVDDKDTPARKRRRLERWSEQDLTALRRAVEKYPDQTWDLLMPHVERLVPIQADRYDPKLKKWQEESFRHHETNIARGVVELLIFAAQTLAAKQPEELIARTSSLETNASSVVQEIIMAGYTLLPACYADRGIGWLIAAPARFRLGSGYGEPEWLPAARLLKALSPHCSERLFRKAEEVIVHYHSPQERRNAEFYLKECRNGYFRHFWGKTQYFLLPALDAKRIQISTTSLIRVLKRKFEHYSNERFLRGGISSGGFTGSKLGPNLEKISDRAWLKIVDSKKVAGHNSKRVQIGPDRVLETSIHQFSGSLSRIAKRFPERFGCLALRFPDDVHPSYVSAILDGFGQMQPGEEVPETEKANWQPASIGTVEAMLDKHQAGDDRETAMSFCHFIQRRAGENWSEKNIARLVHYACTHPDLEIGRLNVDCDKSSDEATVDILSENSINCVRGAAAGAIGELLWERKDRLEQVRSGIESLIHDPHPAVRIAAIESVEPVLNIDKGLAVHWFCEACKDDLRVAASRRASRFFNYIIPSHINKIGPMIQRMVLSSLDEVANEGARQVTARWLFHGFFKNEFADCLKGTVAQRKGVTDVAASLLNKKDYSLKCQEILCQSMNDPDKEVRDKLRGIFSDNGLLNTSEYAEFIRTYAKSQAFADDHDHLVFGLKEITGSLIGAAEAIFAVCEGFSTSLNRKTRDVGSTYSYSASEVSSILLRLYEQAQGEQNKQISERCLDIWDLFFQNRVGMAIELSRAIER